VDEEHKKHLGMNDNKPSKAAIRAHHLGKDDFQRAKILASRNKLSTKKIINILKDFAQMGDLYRLSLKFDMQPNDVRNLLSEFGILDPTDARAAINGGLLGAIQNAWEDTREATIKQDRLDHTETARRLNQHKADFNLDQDSPSTVDEVAAQMKIEERRIEAERLNAETKARFQEYQNTKFTQEDSKFRIPDSLVPQFKTVVLHGIETAMRRFGGSRKDIINEVKRLMPEIDVDLLR
jgi:hypothetical protein